MQSRFLHSNSQYASAEDTSAAKGLENTARSQVKNWLLLFVSLVIVCALPELNSARPAIRRQSTGVRGSWELPERGSTNGQCPGSSSADRSRTIAQHETKQCVLARKRRSEVAISLGLNALKLSGADCTTGRATALLWLMNPATDTHLHGSHFRGYIPTLDGWRAIAILAVVFHHAMLPLVKTYHWLEFSEQGAMGVDVFFALSGFLICTRLMEEQRKNGKIDVGAFYLRRVFRILPPYLMYLLVVFSLSLAGWFAVNWQDWLSCLTFTRNYLPGHLWSWETGQFWSLSVEEHFYLLFPALLVFAGVRRMKFVLPALIGGLTLWRMADYRFHFFDHVLKGTVFPYRSDIRMDAIALGCLAAILVGVPGIRRFIENWTSSPVILGLAGLLLISIFRNVPLALLLQRELIPVLIVTTSLKPEAWACRWLEWRWVKWIGALSYSIYIWQQLFFQPDPDTPGIWLQRIPFLREALQHHAAQTWPYLLPVLAMAALGCAILSFYLVEQPLIQLGRNLMSRKKEKAHLSRSAISLPAAAKT